MTDVEPRPKKSLLCQIATSSPVLNEVPMFSVETERRVAQWIHGKEVRFMSLVLLHFGPPDTSNTLVSTYDGIPDSAQVLVLVLVLSTPVAARQCINAASGTTLYM